MYKLIKEVSRTTTGGGLDTGDAWPDGLFTKYGEKRVMEPAGMPRGMIQIVAPAADSIYGGDGSKREVVQENQHKWKNKELLNELKLHQNI